MITQSKTGFTHLSWSHLSGPCSAHSQSPRAETFFCETPGRSHHYAQVSALVWLWAHSSRASRIINPSVTVIHLAGTLTELRAALIFRCRNITEFKIHMQWLPRWDSTPYVSGFASETGSRCDSVDSSSNLDLFFLIESSWLGVKTESRSWGVWGRVQYIPALKSCKLVKHFQKSSCHITTTSYKLHPVLKKNPHLKQRWMKRGRRWQKYIHQPTGLLLTSFYSRAKPALGCSPERFIGWSWRFAQKWIPQIWIVFLEVMN